MHELIITTLEFYCYGWFQLLGMGHFLPSPQIFFLPTRHILCLHTWSSLNSNAYNTYVHGHTNKGITYEEREGYFYVVEIWRVTLLSSEFWYKRGIARDGRTGESWDGRVKEADAVLGWACCVFKKGDLQERKWN